MTSPNSAPLDQDLLYLLATLPDHQPPDWPAEFARLYVDDQAAISELHKENERLETQLEAASTHSHTAAEAALASELAELTGNSVSVDTDTWGHMNRPAKTEWKIWISRWSQSFQGWTLAEAEAAFRAEWEQRMAPPAPAEGAIPEAAPEAQPCQLRTATGEQYEGKLSEIPY